MTAMQATTRRAPATRAGRAITLATACMMVLVACGSSGTAPAAAPCDVTCKDGVAVRALRETMKLVFNLTVQGKPVGPQDATTPCPLGGSAHVTGEASSNALQGASFVKLTYSLDHCSYLQKTDTPKETYAMAVSGTVTQEGTLAVQPSATTALLFASDGVTFEGTVYDPPIAYSDGPCRLSLAQNGNRLSGTVCGKTAATDL